MIDIYSENILDHFKNPKNFGHLDNPNAKANDVNPICGDEVTIELAINNKKISDVKFYGKGCAISQAAASMLTEEVKGKDVEDVVTLENNFIVNILNVNLSAMRVKCALLSMKVLKLAAINYLGK